VQLNNHGLEKQEISEMTANSSTARIAQPRGSQNIADRVEIEALRAEFTDAVMMRDYDRLAALFTADGALRIPEIPIDLTGQDEIRAWGAQVPDVVEYLLQTAHPGTVVLDGDTASGRVFIHEVVSARDGRSGQNDAIYHDRYQRTQNGWRFSERVYEIKYLDMTPLAGAPPTPRTPSHNSSGGR
jgi:ketosteroid isomerase-like protein